MNEEHYKDLNAQLGFEFDLFAIEHTGWMHKNVPNGALIVLQTDDVGFNKWARQMAEKNRHLDDEADLPVVLVHVRKMRPQRSRIVKADAELVATPRNGSHGAAKKRPMRSRN